MPSIETIKIYLLAGAFLLHDAEDLCLNLASKYWPCWGIYMASMPHPWPGQRGAWLRLQVRDTVRAYVFSPRNTYLQRDVPHSTAQNVPWATARGGSGCLQPEAKPATTVLVAKTRFFPFRMEPQCSAPCWENRPQPKPRRGKGSWATLNQALRTGHHSQPLSPGPSSTHIAYHRAARWPRAPLPTGFFHTAPKCLMRQFGGGINRSQRAATQGLHAGETTPEGISHQPGSMQNLSLRAARMARGHRGDPRPPSHCHAEGWQHPRCPASSKVDLPPVVPGVPKNTPDPPLRPHKRPQHRNTLPREVVTTKPRGTRQKPDAVGRLPTVCREPAAPAPCAPARKFPARGQARLSPVVSATAGSKAGSNKGPDPRSAQRINTYKFPSLSLIPGPDPSLCSTDIECSEPTEINCLA